VEEEEGEEVETRKTHNRERAIDRGLRRPTVPWRANDKINSILNMLISMYDSSEGF